MGQPVALTWASTNATSCTASGAWSGSLQTSGSQAVTATAAGALTYSISCTGPGGSANASSVVTAATASLLLTNTFAPNAVTISTSEGAPYGDADMWLGAGGPTLRSAYGYGPTKVIRLYICLSGKVSFNSCSSQPAVTGPLSAQILAGIDAGIAAYAGTGTRVLVRFIYQWDTPTPPLKDPPISVILSHIDQLAPILLKNRDLIFALEAGFIGNFGQWVYGNGSGGTANGVGSDTPAAKKQLLDRELSYFKGVFPVLVPWVGDLMVYAGGRVTVDGLGLHDDDFDSAAGTAQPFYNRSIPAGTTLSQAEDYTAQVSAASVFVGEFTKLYPVGQTCAAIDTYSYQFHAQSISIGIEGWPPGLGASLQSLGCATSFLSKVGTRIELQRSTIIGNATAGSTVFVGLTMVNAGYGRVVRPRPATLIFSSNGNVVGQVPISLQDMDLRQLVASPNPTPKTFSLNVTLPPGLPAGRPISIAVLIPDPAVSLTSQAVYALPLNSVDASAKPIFDATTGYNSIATITVGSPASNTNRTTVRARQ